MRLIQPFHKSEHPVRNAELTQCRERNRESGLFSSIVMPTGRPTFTELFALCGEDEVNVIANSDMYFDASIRLAERCKQGQCLALSRWDVQADGRSVHFDVAWSQDVWIVRGRPSIEAEFTQGVLDCDNVLAWVLQSSGLAVLNPSRAIRSHHLHLSDVRTYRGRGRAPVSVPGPHLHVSPTDMWPLHYPRVHARWRAVGRAWQAPGFCRKQGGRWLPSALRARARDASCSVRPMGR